MKLGEYIQLLESQITYAVCPIGLINPHSWRGDYAKLAFEPILNVTIESMLREAKRAIGCFAGWKGGVFEMGEETTIHIDYRGDSSGGLAAKTIIQIIHPGYADEILAPDRLVDVAVNLMLSRATIPAKLLPNWVIECTNIDCNAVFQVEAWAEGLLRKLVANAAFLARLGKVLLENPGNQAGLGIALSIEGHTVNPVIDSGVRVWNVTTSNLQLHGISLSFFMQHEGHALIVRNLND